MTKPVFGVSDLQGNPMAPVGSFGKQIGLEGPGVKSVTVPLGKRAFSVHTHLGNCEMFAALEGQGTCRFGATEHAVRDGQDI